MPEEFAIIQFIIAVDVAKNQHSKDKGHGKKGVLNR